MSLSRLANNSTPAPNSDDHTEVSQQKQRLQSDLVATSSYASSIFQGLHPLRDSIVWDSGAASHICNNLD